MFVQSNCGFVYISNNNWYWLINDLVACVHYFSPIICGIRFNALCIGSGLGSLYNSLRPSFLLEYWVKVPFKDERERSEYQKLHVIKISTLRFLLIY